MTDLGHVLEVQSPCDGDDDLMRLELGYEDEGFYNYKLQLGQAD